jgi:adenylate cyclase
MPTLKSLLQTVLLTSLVFTVPIVGIRFLGGFEGAELAAYDDFVRRRPAEPKDDRIVVVTISDDDIEALQQYPIHDGTLAQALETLDGYQPRAIGLDISRDIPHGLPAGRDRLTQVIKKGQSIVTGCLLSTETSPGSPPAPGTPPESVAFAEFPIDFDKVVRRVKLVSTPGRYSKRVRTNHVCNDAKADNEIPSLSFQVALMFLDAANIKPDSAASREIQFRQTVLRRIDPRFGGYAHADVEDYQMMLNYRGANRVFREISILDVLRQKVDPQLIRDRVVLIGNMSEVSKDEFNTPFIETKPGSRTMTGVLVHAQATSQILGAVLDQRPLIHSWPEAGKILWIWGWALGAGTLAFFNRRLILFLLGTIAVGAGLWGVCSGLFLLQGLWIPFAPTLAAAMLTAFGVRLVDLAARSGYAKAIYDQMREQLQGGGSRDDRKGAYLENLVQRARAVRQGEDVAQLLETQAPPTASTTPEMQALYDQIAAQVRADVAAEQATQRVTIAPTTSNSKASKIQSLLNRAQRSRSSNPDPPNNHLPEDRR